MAYEKRVGIKSGGRRPLCLVGVLLTALTACGGSDDSSFDGPGGADGGPAGSGGSGGSAGTGGATAGSGGGGLAGQAGSAASAGSGGTAGASGGWVPGCASDDDCAASPETPYCSATGSCVACEEGDAEHVCDVGLTCCGQVCVDTGSDPVHCGGCGEACNLPQAVAGCSAGSCTIQSCDGGFADCDGAAANGCETPTAGGGCACNPGEVESCYTGPAATEGVGPCTAGTRTCNGTGQAWGPCEGEVIPASDSCLNTVDDDCDGVVNNGYPNATACLCLPGESKGCYTGPANSEGVGTCHGGTAVCLDQGTGYTLCTGEVTPMPEVCGNGQDEDCNGVADDSLDEDGDGWTVCEGDCCDRVGPACGSPALVNPGAVEVAGDGVDNNCNGDTDESPVTACSSGASFTGTTAWDLLHAMDICQTATADTWGVVGTPAITRADGSGAGTIDNLQVSVTTQFGSDASNLPRFGSTFAVLSSGRARDANDPDATAGMTYSYVNGNPPADFVAPHGGQLPSTGAGCPNGSGANDSVVLDVQLKVPTNANSFSFQFRFFSQEYWTYTCTQFNDFFVALLDSTWTPQPGGTPIPADKNISFDANGNYISVNSQQFFTVCPPKAGYPCPDGQAGLVGTGYTYGPGGGTVWLTTTSPVTPGETVRLRFAIWDTSDRLLDSIVLLDNFRWSATPSDGPVTE